MEKLPFHCQENAVLLKQNDYMNFEMMSDGVKTSLTFDKAPNFYTIFDKEYFLAEMRTEGLKVGTVAVASENILNIKLHDSEELSRVKNLNFLIPDEVNAQKATIEVFNDTIYLKAPLKKKKQK